MALKPKPSRPRRTRLMNLRMTEEEWRTLGSKAKAARMPKSELLRVCVDRLRVTPRADRREVLLALARVGSNLNQIARWANTHKGAAEALEVCLYLQKVEGELRGLERAVFGRGELEAVS
jgi:hypothetical protein